MTLRIAIALIVLVNVAHACDCGWPSVREAKRRSDVIFRGTITEIRQSGHGYNVAVFKVSRVWKGDVGEIFEMPAIKETTACIGFWPHFLEVGNELLVYAFRFKSDEDYMTDICTRTSLAQKSEDFKQLGRGRPPRRSK